MATTPLMAQYQQVKDQYRDSILLYRMGDFYELFNEDAVTASKVLGLTLTSRNQANSDRTPLAGFPYHAVERYLPRLINAGYKVAICEQVEDPAEAKGIVKREVVEVITRGTAINENCLEAKSNNYIAALFPAGEASGLAYLDLSTGLFRLLEGAEQEAADEIFRLGVREVLISDDAETPAALAEITASDRILTTRLASGYFNLESARRLLCTQFAVPSLDVFGCGQMENGISAAGALLEYVRENKKSELRHLVRIETCRLDRQMQLDASTIRNLEILLPLHAEDEDGTLFHVLDRTVTAMGGRALKYWLTHPLIDPDEISVRHDAVEELFSNPALLNTVRGHLREINDIERIMSRIGSQRANARDIQGLGRSLLQAALAAQALEQIKSPMLKRAEERLLPLKEQGEALMDLFVERPPLTIREGGMLNPARHPDLRKIIQEAADGKQWINQLEASLKDELGINTLKVGYNRVFGYYIEVTKQHAPKIPETFIRKQTLVNGERYITPEMKEWESIILNAEGRANAVEYERFCEIREETAGRSAEILNSARVLAEVDVLCSLALSARESGYCRPEINSGGELKIIQGRHPVVESLAEEGTYIPNDVRINTSDRQILILTGPNMAGKSTYLRQAALITLMAQAGSFVPAAEAAIGIADRIFTRVGASDRLSRGQSTFMVEMIETASILRNATPRSLVLLDEIGRGTSTFDGLSLAWAIVEALHENPAIAARTMFATHYHELTVLPERLKRTVNVKVAVKEVGKEVIFLRKILEGFCDSSYGIQVAGMAGVPEPVINRAWEVLKSLEKERIVPGRKPGRARSPQQPENAFQADLFSFQEPANPNHRKIHDEVLHLNLNNLTPLEVVNKIAGIQQKYSPPH